MNNGGVCNDPQFGISGTQIAGFIGNTTTNGGSVLIGQITSASPSGSGTTTNSTAIANFEQTTGGSFGGGSVVSLGGCTLSESLASGGSSTTTGLNPGTLTVTGSSGGPVTLTSLPTAPGTYFGQLPSGSVASGSTFTFTGSGGSGAGAVGAFSANVTFPNPLLSWTNQAAAATVSRSQGLLVTWTGGTERAASSSSWATLRETMSAPATPASPHRVPCSSLFLPTYSARFRQAPVTPR